MATELKPRAQPSSSDSARGDGILAARVSAAPTAIGRRRYAGARAEYRCMPPTARCSPWWDRAAAARPRCSSSSAGCRPPMRGSIECAPAVLMPQRDLLLPWLSAAENAALALRIAGLSRAQARARAAALFAELGLDGFQDAHPPSSRAGCASAWPSCARSCRASRSCAWMSRSARSTRSRAQRCRAGSRTRWPGGPGRWCW